jgi:peptidyl-prolyl cis-trans isomerase SurA
MKQIARLPLVAALLLSGASLSAQVVIEQVLVKVNGDIITKTELEQKQIAALRERSNGQIDPELLKNETQLKQALADVTPPLIVAAIDELLLLQMGREKGYKLSDDQFRGWLTKLREEQNLVDDAKFQAALKQEGMTIDDLRRNVERQFIINQVQRDEVGSKLSITEEEARQYYVTHKNEFAEGSSVTLREILIEVPTATKGGQASVSVAAEDEAAERVKAIRARITAGEDFGKVAAEVSAASSKSNGGLIGPIAFEQLSSSLQELLKKMKPGELTEPIRTPRGFQILKLETFKPAEVPPFESVTDVAADKVHAARQQSEVRKFLARVRSQAIIEWKNDELRKAYEKQVAAEATQGSPGADR